MKTSLLNLSAVASIVIAIFLNLNCTKNDNPVEPSNSRPVATIVGLAANASFLAGDTITFTATATDTEDGELGGTSLVWTSSLDGRFGTGSPCQIDTLSVNTHLIILTATDSEGAVGADTATVIISVNNIPVVIITSPADSSTFGISDTISFMATATDSAGVQMDDSMLVWTSDIDGQIGTGDTLATDSISAGTHAIVLTATDSTGFIGADTVTVFVGTNFSPSASIVYPLDSSRYAEGDTITMVGSAMDPDDGLLTGNALVWTSSIDGPIGTGDTLKVSHLTIGSHVITLTATDSDGSTGSDAVVVTIVADAKPTVAIMSPADNSTFNDSDTVTLIGSATDVQDGPLSGGSLAWTSNIDGQFGVGDTVVTSAMSIGTHTVILTATDSHGLEGYAVMTLIIQSDPGANAGISITTPQDGTLYNVGDTITFAGYAVDLEDGALSGSSVVWTSNVDGEFGFGDILETDGLSANTHVITFTATDSDNNIVDTTVTIEISPTFERIIGLSDYGDGYAVSRTSDGGYIIGGRGADLGGHLSFYLIKTDSDGRFDWDSHLGGVDADYGQSAIETTDGGYIMTGTTKSYGAGKFDVYVVKTGQYGNMIWEKTLGGAEDDLGYSVCETSDGGYLITGATYSMGAGYDDIYLIKLDNAGNTVWEKVFGDTSFDRGHSVMETSDGGYLVTGVTIVPDEQGGDGNSDFYLLKTDVSGNLIWESNLGELFHDAAHQTIETTDGGFVVVGYSYYPGGGFSGDIKLVKTDNTGNQLWKQYYGGGNDERAYSVAETLDGGFIIAGETKSYGAGESDVYLVKTDNSGNLIWEKTFGAAGREYGRAVCTTPDGGYMITGQSDSYGIGAFWFQMYLIRTDANGNVQ